MSRKKTENQRITMSGPFASDSMEIQQVIQKVVFKLDQLVNIVIGVYILHFVGEDVNFLCIIITMVNFISEKRMDSVSQ